MAAAMSVFHLPEKSAQHFFSDLKIVDRASAHRAKHADVSWFPPKVFKCCATHRQHFVRMFVDGNNGGFIQHYTSARYEDQRVDCAQVHCKVFYKKVSQESHG